MFGPNIIESLSSVKVTPVFFYIQGKETNKDVVKPQEINNCSGRLTELYRLTTSHRYLSTLLLHYECGM